jgi:PIN domain nuclease of toxin-antitoxin system
LVDTQIAIWTVSGTRALPETARRLILSDNATAVVSAISIFEIATKHSLRRSSSPLFSGTAAIGIFKEAGFELLTLSPEHAAAVDDLPWLHRDPFDRLLVAQALTEPMRLLTADRQLTAYSDTVILC